MIEVFKTNVDSRAQAEALLHLLHHSFPHYRANFDLHDRDRILRVASAKEPVDAEKIIAFLRTYGCFIQPLPDDILPPSTPGLGRVEVQSYTCVLEAYTLLTVK